MFSVNLCSLFTKSSLNRLTFASFDSNADSIASHRIDISEMKKKNIWENKGTQRPFPLDIFVLIDLWSGFCLLALVRHPCVFLLISFLFSFVCLCFNISTQNYGYNFTYLAHLMTLPHTLYLRAIYGDDGSFFLCSVIMSISFWDIESFFRRRRRRLITIFMYFKYVYLSRLLWNRAIIATDAFPISKRFTFVDPRFNWKTTRN